MKFNKKYSVYIAVVAVGGLWVLHDQLSDGPSRANAQTNNPADLVVPHAPHPSPQPQKLETDADAVLAERLDLVFNQTGLDLETPRDAFVVASDWTASQTSTPAATESSASDFIKKHKLVSVMVQSRGGAAQVDGRLLRVGQDLDGFKLLAVTKNTAVFQSDGSRAVLRFPDALPAINASSP